MPALRRAHCRGVSAVSSRRPELAGNDADAFRAADDDLVELALAREHVPEVQVGREPEQHVDVAEAEIGVEHRDAVALARQRHREVDDDVGLADAALAARHGEADDAAARAR